MDSERPSVVPKIIQEIRVRRSLEEEKARESKESVTSTPPDSCPGDSDTIDGKNDFSKEKDQNGADQNHSSRGDLITDYSQEDANPHVEYSDGVQSSKEVMPDENDSENKEMDATELVNKEKEIREKIMESENQIVELPSVMPPLEKEQCFIDGDVSVRRLSQSDSKYICHSESRHGDLTIKTCLSDSILLKKDFLGTTEEHLEGN